MTREQQVERVDEERLKVIRAMCALHAKLLAPFRDTDDLRSKAIEIELSDVTTVMNAIFQLEFDRALSPSTGWKAGVEAAAKVCDDADESAIPTDLADRIRALTPPEKGEGE